MTVCVREGMCLSVRVCNAHCHILHQTLLHRPTPLPPHSTTTSSVARSRSASTSFSAVASNKPSTCASPPPPLLSSSFQPFVNLCPYIPPPILSLSLCLSILPSRPLLSLSLPATPPRRVVEGAEYSRASLKYDIFGVPGSIVANNHNTCDDEAGSRSAPHVPQPQHLQCAHSCL